MAWIRSVTVSNLAGNNRTRSVKLNRDVNIFWGLNGSGKTSLLKILHSALDGSIKELIGVYFSSASIEFQQGDSTYIRKIDIPASVGANREETLFEDVFETEELDFDTPPSVAYDEKILKRSRWITTPPVRTEPAPRRFPHSYLPVSRVPSRISPEVRYQLSRRDRVENSRNIDLFDEIYVGAIQDTWREYATQELEAIREIQLRGLADVLTEVIEREGVDLEKPQPGQTIEATDASRAIARFFKSQDIQLPEKTLRRLSREYASHSLLRRVVAKIVAVEGQVDAAQEPTRKIESLIAEMFSGNKRAYLSSRGISVIAGEKHRLPLVALSSGEKQLLRILVECRAAGNSTIIIDEPELSMHVDWQHILIESMRSINPDAQIIVATHSPEVMAMVNDSKVFEL